VRYSWLNSYSPAATERALESIKDEPVPYKISHMAARLFFRGIYFPRKAAWQWLKLIAQNRRSSSASSASLSRSGMAPKALSAAVLPRNSCLPSALPCGK